MVVRRERWVGAPVRRMEDPDLLRGRGRFAADVHRPGTVHVAFVRSVHAHAKLTAVDVSPALGDPRVLAAVCAADIADWSRPLPLLVPHPALHPVLPHPLAADRVRYVGEPVAAVVAEDRYLAEDAAARIQVRYEALPAVSGGPAALEAGAALLHPDLGDNVAAHFTQRYGDLDAAFATADVVLRERFHIRRGAAHPMETRGIVAEPDPEGGLTVWISSQAPHAVRRVIAELLGMAEHRIRVVAPDVGGGFGPKAIPYPEDVLVPWLALRLGRPVQWVEDRREHFQATTQEREQEHEVELAARADGSLLGLRDRFVADQGAYVPWGIIVPYLTSTTIPGPYHLPAYECDAWVAYTNKAPVAPYRGAGRPQGTFVMERMMDRLAERLGVDPARVRAQNLIRPDEFPYPLGLIYRDGAALTYDSGDYPELLRRALEALDYDAWRERQRALRRQGRRIGIGIGCYVEGTGLGPFEGVVARLDRDGRVVAFTGTAPQGQGHRTTYAQILADAVGLPLASVDVITGDTARLPRGVGTFASRNCVTAGNAALEAGQELRRRILDAAAELLEVRREDLEIADGRVHPAGAPGRGLTLAELARRLGESPSGSTMTRTLEPSLEATAYFRPERATYSSGVHAAVVEVDPHTGEVGILRYVIAHDCGRVINPLLVGGQLQGGLAHGLSGALFEELVYDERGQLLTSTLMDFAIPSAVEVPQAVVCHVETPTPLNPLGVKGAGEGGTIPVPAVVNGAVEDALRGTGGRWNTSPLTPERVRSGDGGAHPPDGPQGNRGAGR